MFIAVLIVGIIFVGNVMVRSENRAIDTALYVRGEVAGVLGAHPETVGVSYGDSLVKPVYIVEFPWLIAVDDIEAVAQNIERVLP